MELCHNIATKLMYALHHLYCYIVFLYRNRADVKPTSALSRYLHHEYHYIVIESTSALSLYSDGTLSQHSDEADVCSTSSVLLYSVSISQRS